MEVTPDIYTWLVNLDLIDLTAYTQIKSSGNVNLPERFIEQLLNTEKFEKLIKKVEEQFNKFYKTSLHYSENVKNLPIPNSQSLRMKNWGLISDTLLHFGISLDQKSIQNIVMHKDKSALLDIIKVIYSLSRELSTKTLDVGGNVGKKHESGSGSGHIINTSNINKSNKSLGNQNKITSVRKDDIIDLNDNNLYKELEKTESTLEFFINSLSKALDMRTRQVAALLSNNRKYLIQIASKGIKGDYSKVQKWIQELQVSTKHLVRLVKSAKDVDHTRTITFATVSVGFYSKNIDLVYSTFNLVSNLQIDLGTDWEWLITDGIISFFAAINRHKAIRTDILKLIILMVEDKQKEFLAQVKKLQSERVFEFLGNIIENIKEITNTEFKYFLSQFLLDYCFLDNSDKPTAFSILVDYWLTEKDLLDATCDMIINTLKRGIKNCIQKHIQKAAISMLFKLFGELGKIRNAYAPTIYKLLIHLFLESYDDIFLKEEFITHFIAAFKYDSSIPLMIFTSPYFQLLRTSPSYDINDFKFLIYVIDHPKINDETLKEIFPFVCRVSQENYAYTRLANSIINMLLEKNFILDTYIVDFFVNFIKENISNFLSTPHNLMLLESSFDIITLNISAINHQLESFIVEAIERYKTEYKKNSYGLLSLLWFFENHDDVLLNLSEKFAEKYPKLDASKVIKKKKKGGLFAGTASQETKRSQIKKPAKHKKFSRSNKSNGKSKGNETDRTSRTGSVSSRNSKRKKKVSMNNISKREEELQKKKIQQKIEFYSKKNEEYQKSLILPSLNISRDENLHNKSTILAEGALTPILPVHEKELESLKSFNLLNLDEEETCDKTSIDILCNEYQDNIKYYFNSYLTDQVNGFISKAALLKMFRDFGISKGELSTEDFNMLIRHYFSTPLSSFNFNQYVELMIQYSNFIFSKSRKFDSPSQHFHDLCKLMLIPLVKKEDLIINKITKELKKNPNLIIPPGYKKKDIVRLENKYFIPDCMKNILGEGKVIALEIIDLIINKAFSKHTLEPYKMQSNDFEIVPTFNKLNWNQDLTLAYLNLDKSVKDEGIEAANLIQDLLKTLELGKTSFGERIVNAKEISDREMIKSLVFEHKKKENKRIQRHKMVKKELEREKEEKKQKDLQIEEELKKLKMEREEKLKIQLLKEKNLREKLKEQIAIAKKLKEDERLRIEQEEKSKKTEYLSQKHKETREVLIERRKKLKTQFQQIVNKNFEIRRKIEDDHKYKLPPRKVKRDKTKEKKEKEYHDFDHNLNNTLIEMMKRIDIKRVFDEYKEHLEIIYEVYSKSSLKKLGRFNEPNVHLNEFKDFCHTFTILGLLINVDQMINIFRKVSRINEGEQDERSFLKFDDFNLALFYISIYSKYTNKSRKILPEDLEKVNGITVNTLFDFIGLSLPFDRYELENLINKRRNLTVKQYLKLQEESRQQVFNYIRPEEKIKMEKNYESVKRGILFREKKKISVPILPKLKGDKPEKTEKTEKSYKEKVITTEGTTESKKLIKELVGPKEDSTNLNIIGPGGSKENWELKNEVKHTESKHTEERHTEPKHTESKHSEEKKIEDLEIMKTGGSNEDKVI